jgi:glycosyltransferase involved in cell wall biosynthesis
MSDLISIIVPVYNAENYILKCLQSISLQTYLVYEVLIINDGSTDASAQIILDFIKDKPQFRLFTKVNEGVSVARNYGIERASGSYLSFVDADDYVARHYLEKLYAPFENNLELGLSCGGYYELSRYAKGGIALHDFQAVLDQGTIDVTLFYDYLFQGVTGVLWGKLFVATVVRQHCLALHPEINLSEDLVFVFEYVTHIRKIALVNSPLYYYNRLHENGLSGLISLQNVPDLERVHDALLQVATINKLFFLEPVIRNRYNTGVLKIAQGICARKGSSSRKKNNLKQLYTLSKSRLTHLGISSLEQKIYWSLFVNRCFISLIIITSVFQFLRRVKRS